MNQLNLSKVQFPARDDEFHVKCVAPRKSVEILVRGLSERAKIFCRRNLYGYIFGIISPPTSPLA